MEKENRLYSISLGVASLQGGLVGVATALSPATCRPFQVFSPSFFVGLELIVQKYGAVLQQPGLMFRRESELPFPKAVIRRRLADALLNEDLDENIRNQLAVG